MSLTGRPCFAFAIWAACKMKSLSFLRPKPPPINVLCIVSALPGNPVTSASSAGIRLPACVGAHTSQVPASTIAVAHSGSIAKWARYGTEYSRSIFMPSASSARLTSDSSADSTGSLKLPPDGKGSAFSSSPSASVKLAINASPSTSVVSGASKVTVSTACCACQ